MGLRDRENKRASVVSSLISNSPAGEELQEEETIVRSYKITMEIYQKIKIQAATEKKKDYQIVQEALDQYFGKKHEI